MKKAIMAILVWVFLLVVPGQAQAESLHAMFMVDAPAWCDYTNSIHEMDAVPFIENGRTYIPIRFLAYSLDITDDNIAWNPNTQIVVLTKDNIVVSVRVGDNILNINGSPKVMDVTPIVRNNRTYLPARYVVEAFGANVDWNEENQTIVIVYGRAPQQALTSTSDTGSSSTIVPPLTLWSDDGENIYLGKLTANEYDSEGIFNEYGSYGSEYSLTSIWNKYGTYGSKYSLYSAFNQYTITPPVIKDANGTTIGRLSINKYVIGAINPYEIEPFLVKLGY